MSISSNLPPVTTSSTANYFENYYSSTFSYPSELIDAVVGFFEKRGFAKLSATSTAAILLQQSSIDNVDVMALLNTLSGLSDVQLSAIVAEVLNYNRESTSILGFKQIDTTQYLEQRNIIV